MMEEHSRFAIWNQSQHPYRHSLSEFAYVNPALPGVTNIEGAVNWILAVLYPSAKPDVATVGDLPLVGNTINDYRVVQDDGDGKSASYRWEQREGEVAPSWHKIYDMDWGVDSVLSSFMNATQDLYYYKPGLDERDGSGNFFTGKDAGQRMYGGSSANTHLTIVANSGDGVGPQTGFIQFLGNVRPYDDDTFNLGTPTERFGYLYVSQDAVIGSLTLTAGNITDSSGNINFTDNDLNTTGDISANKFTATDGFYVGNMLIASGSITDGSGAISFGDENLSTSGTLLSGTHTIGNMVISTSQITNLLGTIDFDNENLVTTGTITAGSVTFSLLNVDNLRLDGNTLSSTDVNGNIILLPNGTGIVDVQKTLQTLNITTTGTQTITGQLNVDNLRLDGNSLISTNANGTIFLTPNGTGQIAFSSIVYPVTNTDLGKTANLFKDLYLNGNLTNGTTSVSLTTLLALRSSRFRDLAQTLPAQAGDSLFWDAVNSVWLASKPDSEIDHGTLLASSLTDDDHLQYLLLAGRSGGQSVIGGTDAGNDLTLESTSNVTKGNIRIKNNLLPFTDASYSGSWSGLDLGSNLRYFRDIYLKGEARGLRLENFVSSGLPASSAANVGRLIYETDTKKIKVDDGTVFRVAGVSKFISDLSFDGIVTTKDTNVSANIQDARNAIIQLLDNANNFERVNCTIKATSASNVRIETTPALPAGSYRLIVIE